MPSYIVINRHIIQANTKTGGNEPPIRITKGRRGKPIYARRVRITGPSELIYDPLNPVLPCGARLTMVVEGMVEVLA